MINGRAMSPTSPVSWSSPRKLLRGPPAWGSRWEVMLVCWTCSGPLVVFVLVLHRLGGHRQLEKHQMARADLFTRQFSAGRIDSEVERTILFLGNVESKFHLNGDRVLVSTKLC